MSLRSRFLLISIAFAALAVILVLVVRHQTEEVREVRHRIEEDWRETRLLFDIQSALTRIHASIEVEGAQASIGSLRAHVAQMQEASAGIRRLATRDLAGIEAEEDELEALEEIDVAVQEVAALVDAMEVDQLEARDPVKEMNAVFERGSAAVTAYAAGSLEELDHSLSMLDRREDRIRGVAVGISAGMAGLLAFLWVGVSIWLLRPIARMRRMVRRVRDRDFRVDTVAGGPGEIGELLSLLAEMAAEIRTFTEELESRVRRRTAELEASRGQLLRMLDGVPEAVALVDGADHVIARNEPWRMMFGERDDSVGRLLDGAAPGADGFFRFRGTDANERLLNITRRSLEEGERAVMLEHVSDVTMLVRTQAALASTQKLASLGRISAGLAHEINNPLAAIVACAEGLLRRERANPNPDPTVREYLETIHAEVFRCKEITGKLLDFSRHRPSRPGPCDPTSILRDAARLTAPLAMNAGVSVVVAECAVEEASTDEGAVRQILLNLLLNAIEASDPGSTVELRCEEVSGELRFIVIDNGSGIAREDMPHLFEPFFSRRRDGSGTGLGLFVCLGMAQAMGGAMIAHSDGPGTGARMELRLPNRVVPANHQIESKQTESVHA